MSSKVFWFIEYSSPARYFKYFDPRQEGYVIFTENPHEAKRYSTEKEAIDDAVYYFGDEWPSKGIRVCDHMFIDEGTHP
jgi:hypothetical protein